MNSPPLAGADTATTLVNTAVTLSVLLNDMDPDGTLDPASVRLVSLPTAGSVTVTGAASEDLTVTRAEFRSAKGEWRIEGTSTRPGSVVTLFVGPLATGTVIGTATANGVGGWSFRQTGSPVVPDGSNTVSVRSDSGATELAAPLAVRR